MFKSKQHYPSTVWYLSFITFLTKTLTFMMLPLVIIYLSKHHYDTDKIGFILGIGWVTGAFGGPIVGYLSDRIGTKKVYIGILSLWVISFFGFGLFINIWLLCSFALLNGFCRSTIDVIILKRMFSAVPKEQFKNISTMQYVALNCGTILGTTIGASIGKHVTGNWFLIIGIIYIFILLVDLPLSYSKEKENSEEQISIKQTVSVLVRDRALFWHLLSGVCFLAGYIQLESGIPMLLNHMNNIHIYAMLLIENGLFIILLAVPITKWVSPQPLNRVVFLSAILMGLGLLCFSFNWLPLYFVGMALLSVGEIVFFPLWRAKITSLGEGMQGTYIGITNFGDLGFFIGSALSGFLFKNGNSFLTFGVIALLVQFIYVFYFLGIKKEKSVPTNASYQLNSGN